MSRPLLSLGCEFPQSAWSGSPRNCSSLKTPFREKSCKRFSSRDIECRRVLLAALFDLSTS